MNDKPDKNNFLIDITDEELNTLKQDRYNENEKFLSLLKEFCDLLNNNEENSDGERIKNTYLEKMKSLITL